MCSNNVSDWLVMVKRTDHQLKNFTRVLACESTIDDVPVLFSGGERKQHGDVIPVRRHEYTVCPNAQAHFAKECVGALTGAGLLREARSYVDISAAGSERLCYWR